MNAREKNTNLFVFDERRTEKETNIMAKVGIVMQVRFRPEGGLA